MIYIYIYALCWHLANLSQQTVSNYTVCFDFSSNLNIFTFNLIKLLPCGCGWCNGFSVCDVFLGRCKVTNYNHIFLSLLLFKCKFISRMQCTFVDANVLSLKTALCFCFLLDRLMQKFQID